MATKKVAEKPTESKEPEKLKRGSYKERECPYCHKMVRNLGNHIKMAHAAEAPPPPEPTKESLLGIETAKPQDSGLKAKITYFCSSCRAEVRKGESQCWNCHETLLWEGIE